MSNRILITGAFGFIGSHLCETFVKKGFHVVAFDRYNINNNFGWLENSKFKNDIEFILGDIRDYDSVQHSLIGVDSVIHMAALIGIPYSYISPLAYLKTNTEGTYNILENCRKKESMNQILITSTSEVYGSAQSIPMDENHPINPQSPYAASKSAADQLASSYNLSFNLPIKIIRPFNCYGPRQSARAVIPSIISQLILGNNINVGNIETKRDFTYVLDTCLAVYEIYKQDFFINKTVNIGSGFSISISEIINILTKLKNKKNKEVNIIKENKRLRPEKSEVIDLVCNNNLLKSNTKWSVKTDLNSGLNETIKFILNNIDLYKQIYNV